MVYSLGMKNLAPTAESYVKEPKFRFAPNQKEIDFAQIVASGGDMVEALKISSMVSSAEYAAASREQLYAMGTRLLSSPSVQERLDYYLQLHKAGMNISAERIQQELASVSFADFAQLFHPEDGPIVDTPNEFYDLSMPESPNNQKYVRRAEWKAGDPITNPHDLPRHLRAAVKEWKIDKEGVLVCKFHDKLKSSQMLGDMQGLFDEANRSKATQVNISIGDGGGGPRTINVADPQPRPIIDITPKQPDCLK